MKKLFVLILSFANCFPERAPYDIILYLRPLWEAPKELSQKTKQKFQKKLEIPGYLNNKLIEKQRHNSQSLSGVFATYAGYSTFSTKTGQIIFPRFNSNPEIYILITPSIQPILQPTAPKTIRNLALTNIKTKTGEDNYKLYKLKLIKDPQSDLYYWYITKEKLRGYTIPDNTIIFFAMPKYIYVPTGSILDKYNIKLNQTGTNLVLPDIYASYKIEKPFNALKFIKLRKLFEPLKKAYKYEPDLSRYMMDIKNKNI